MINENIRKARKAKGLSQEAVAVKLNVVRQTVSKWENGLSVPDADILIQMAELLEVPVGQLLGAGVPDGADQDLTQQLVQLNEELAAKAKQERLTQQVNKKRGIILFLCLISLPTALAFRNEVVSLALFGGCVLAALVVFYRNLTLLTGPAATGEQLRAVRAASVFTFAFAGGLLAVAGLHQSGLVVLSDKETEILLLVCVAVMMLFMGFIAPKLPFNRYTGLRLPWTVRDEDTWNVAHRILGYLSLPLALLYVAACWTVSDFGFVTACVLLLWIGIPGVLSLIFFWKKTHGKL